MLYRIGFGANSLEYIEMEGLVTIGEVGLATAAASEHFTFPMLTTLIGLETFYSVRKNGDFLLRSCY